ncbi:SMP-30/gluconolactonase/LRE family protein [Ferruginibacter sp. SUN106]|uniref:SMP-30/gluconolactonase/LRE family protein n=1 Tax=Ferruginibacter sp. SUN106 TaxID=2978348 RepID=UPI003D35AD67
MKKIMLPAFCVLLFCYQSTAQNKFIGTVERIDPSLDAIIMPGAKAEIIAEGFKWSEGPLWLEKINALIFSDVPENKIYKWTPAKGKELYLTPSGYTDTIKRGGEMGSNGLLLNNKGQLVLCQDGNRQMGIMNAPLDHPAPSFITIAGTYKGKRFSSPNDAVYNKAGELFFTDPPYGLETQSDTDPKKEIPFNGVYKVKKNGEVILLIDSLPRPNGIAFLKGEKKLVIACSDSKKPNWYVYDVKGDALINGKIFYSTIGSPKGERGAPDGMKVDSKGNIFASGPGGIWIFSKDAKLLGKLHLTEQASNCALSTDEKILYITNNMQVLKFKMRD